MWLSGEPKSHKNPDSVTVCSEYFILSKKYSNGDPQHLADSQNNLKCFLTHLKDPQIWPIQSF